MGIAGVAHRSAAPRHLAVRVRKPSVVWLGVAAGVTATAFLRRGAFFFPDSVVVVVAMWVAAVLWRRRLRGADRAVVVAAIAFAAWWLLLAFPWTVPHRVVLLPSTVLACTAAFVIGGGLDAGQRRIAQRLLLVLGSVLALTGLAGVALRQYPLAMPHGGLWRAAGPLTYANALGLALAMLLPLALCGSCTAARWHRAATFLMAAGLVATMSRGALIAAAVALILVRGWRSPAFSALAMGGAVGLAAAAGAGSAHAQPDVLLLTGLGLVVATAWQPPSSAWPRMLVLAAALAAGAILLLGSRAPLSGRVDPASAGERVHEWNAAMSQFLSHPVAGAGPERILVLDRDQVTYFAHNEYLQIAAGGGLIALGLLSAFGWTL